MEKIVLKAGQLVNLLTYEGNTHICVTNEAPNQDVLQGLDARQVTVLNNTFLYVGNLSIDETEEKQYFQVTSDFIITTSNVDVFAA